MPFYPDAACTDEERETMLNSLYLARLDCVNTRTGDVGHMDPIQLVELNTYGRTDFVARRYRRGREGDQPSSGFGFGFRPFTTRGVHKARVMVLDLGKWKLRHLVHLLCELLTYFLLSNKMILNLSLF